MRATLILAIASVVLGNLQPAPSGALVAPPMRTLPPTAGAPASPLLAYTSGCCVLSGAVYVREADGTSRQVAGVDEPIPSDPTWSPEGSRLAFVFNALGVGTIVTAAADGRGGAELLRTPGFYVAEPSWSPAGGWIAFSGWTATGVYWGIPSVGSVMLVSEDGARVIPVAPGAGPAWSPDGSKLAFVGPEGGVFVGAIGAAGLTSIRRVSPTGIMGCCIAWSPRGDRLAFLGAPVGDVDYLRPIWVVNADGTGPRQLRARTGETPAWSPSGRWLAFTGRHLRIISADGRIIRTVTRNAYGTPAWSPDGLWIAFRSSDQTCCDSSLELVRPNGNSREIVMTTGGRPGLAWSRARAT